MKTQLINFTIPEELLRKVDKIARRQYRSRSEALREAVRQLIDDVRQKESDFELIGQSGRQINLTEDEALALVDRVRSKLPLNK